MMLCKHWCLRSKPRGRKSSCCLHRSCATWKKGRLHPTRPRSAATDHRPSTTDDRRPALRTLHPTNTLLPSTIVYESINTSRSPSTSRRQLQWRNRFGMRPRPLFPPPNDILSLFPWSMVHYILKISNIMSFKMRYTSQTSPHAFICWETRWQM